MNITLLCGSLMTVAFFNGMFMGSFTAYIYRNKLQNWVKKYR